MLPPKTLKVSNNPKRVRTGCLTCRGRHLKCDEAVPDCLNCRKSNRKCKRGLRLNFLDVAIYAPPRRRPPQDWAIQFRDESRLIASEYQGGLGRYPSPPHCAPVGQVADEKALRLHPQHKQHAFHASRWDKEKCLWKPDASSVSPPVRTQRQRESKCSSYSLNQSTCAMSWKSDDGIGYPYDSLGSLNSKSLRFLNSSWTDTEQQIVRSDTETERLPCQDGFEAVGAKRQQSGNYDTGQNQPALLQEESYPKKRMDLLSPSPDEGISGADREFLRSPEEIRFLQVFVENVGVWMDSLNGDRHFSQVVPHQSLRSSMLLNSILACGARHVSLTQPDQGEQALLYYNTSTTQLLRSLQNPDRNTIECATAALILNVYEVMSEKSVQHMNHIAGARALIRDCGWNANSTGIGLACFWLSIEMEVMSCLSAKKVTARNPDEWGLDLSWTRRREGESAIHVQDVDLLWTRRILWIVASIVNYRASPMQSLDGSPHDEQIRLRTRLIRWQELKSYCDWWNRACPRTMHPIGYSCPETTGFNRYFPKIWLLKREAILGRLLYHVAQFLLAQISPMEITNESDETCDLQLHHARQICGIVSHMTDQGASIIALRSLAVVSPTFHNHWERMEVLKILDSVRVRRGWYVGNIEMEIKCSWGCDHSDAAANQFVDEQKNDGLAHAVTRGEESSCQQGDKLVRLDRREDRAANGQSGETATTANPFGHADFKFTNRPYQNWYERPTHGDPWNFSLH